MVTVQKNSHNCSDGCVQSSILILLDFLAVFYTIDAYHIIFTTRIIYTTHTTYTPPKFQAFIPEGKAFISLLDTTFKCILSYLSDRSQFFSGDAQSKLASVFLGIPRCLVLGPFSFYILTRLVFLFTFMLTKNLN